MERKLLTQTLRQAQSDQNNVNVIKLRVNYDYKPRTQSIGSV
jgi:hypothetical protein